ncbi:hypothetical protein E2C01_080103 [Portunus trituberculatus]|uniref:Uncharacterized protein n=1 Tax=Portunus trituberculatus TaxID=210409 RepID=A0A5B7ISI6_PORTR|nr:hypothetical protein [Portunus trituberculatus]
MLISAAHTKPSVGAARRGLCAYRRGTKKLLKELNQSRCGGRKDTAENRGTYKGGEEEEEEEEEEGERKQHS